MMEKDFIYPGADLKFRVTTDYEDFSIDDDDFRVSITDRYGRVRYDIPKDECFQDSEGSYYFTVEKARSGWYWAKFEGFIDDGDFSDMKCSVIDQQPFIVVGYCPGHAPYMHDCDKGKHKVSYERVYISGDYLVDVNGEPILTAEGNYIVFGRDKIKNDGMGKTRLSMTGDEFKELIEGRKPDGIVDTLPEVMDVLTGIGDTDDILGGVTDEDIEEWFEKDDNEGE